jgi:hypothetical protein
MRKVAGIILIILGVLLILVLSAIENSMDTHGQNFPAILGYIKWIFGIASISGGYTIVKNKKATS